MIKINNNFLSSIINKSQLSVRKRTMYNFHSHDADVLQRMLNVMQKGTYFCPHRHVNPDKCEVFILIKGKVVIVEFDDSGNINDYIYLNREKGNYGVEIALRSWHSLVCLENDTVLYELKDGPYDENNAKEFAPWAPLENTPESIDYLNNLEKQILILIDEEK